MDLSNVITKEVIPVKKVFKAKSAKPRARPRLIPSQTPPSRVTFREWTRLTSSKASIEMEEAKREERENCGGCEKKVKKPAAVCSLCHRRFCRDCKYFQEAVPLEKHKANSIPESAFSRNDYEKKILIDYLEKKQWTLAHEFKKKLKEMQARRWKYKDAASSLVTLKPSDPVCRKCFDTVWGDMLYRYRESLNSAVPDAVKRRPKCWFGRECTAQARDLDHAKKYNHICEKK